MKTAGFVAVSFLVLSQTFAFGRASPSSDSSEPDPPPSALKSATPSVVANYDKLPLSFESNQGQSDPQVAASYSGDATYSSSTGTFTENIAGPPSTITAFSGSGQTAEIGTAFASPLVALVEDANGAPVPGVSITFSGADLEFSPTTLTTDSAGKASVFATPTSSGGLAAIASVTGGVIGVAFPLLGTGSAVYSLQLIPIQPCRIADTRNSSGPYGGPELTAGSAREFDIPQSGCNIPSTAMAYSLNVTVIPNGSLNYLTLWPSGQAQPNVSTLNSDGRIKANAAIVPAGVNGGVSVFATDPTQLILDIDGYFEPAGTTGGLAFFPVTPCRIADTRNAAGPLGGPYLSAQSSRAFPVQSSGCGLPATAQAYSLNVTALPHSTLNYLTVWPTGEAQPNVSTLNSSTGVVAANAAIVAAGNSGEASVFVSDAADVILDVNGYFAPPAMGGLALYTATPCRGMDTRSFPGAFNGVYFLLGYLFESQVCFPPYIAEAYLLNATAVPDGALNYLTLWPEGTAQPNVSTLNAEDGAITSNMMILPIYNFAAVYAYADGTTNLIFDLYGYFAP